MFHKSKFLMISVLMISKLCFPLSQELREKGFVYLYEIDPTIKISLRYYGSENFVGSPVDGYKKKVVILTKAAAEALKKVQEEVAKDGFCLIIYDAYRPQEAVNHFMKWSKDTTDQIKKMYYYPRIDKEKVFELGYVAKRSGHSRGSTIDLTLMKKDQEITQIKEKKRTLLEGFSITILDDNTVDMGSSFDLFDVASHTESNLIEEEFKKSRNYLKSIMEKNGFKNYAEEWWHFTLKNEPFPANNEESYFNFPIE